MITISVIVPVYNVQFFLHRCVDSILSQTFRDYELILVDDGSTDNSGYICDDYAKKNICIKVIHQKNQGQAVARNNAVAQAQGKWICFVDSDDVIHPQMLEMLYNAVINNKANISMCSVVEKEQIPESFSNIKKQEYCVYDMNENIFFNLYEEGAHRCWIVCGKLIYKEIIENIPFTAGRIYEDNAVVCRWLYEAQIVADIKDELYFYYKNPSGTTKSQFNLKKLDYLWALEEIIAFYKEKEFNEMYKKFLNIYIETAVGFYWKVLNELNRIDIAKKISKDIRRLYHKNRKIIMISREKKYNTYNVMYPNVMRIYRILQRGIKKLK